MIHSGALGCLQPLLSPHHSRSVKKEACWTLSNITAGSVGQIQAVIDAAIFPPLIANLASADFVVKREAVWVVANAVSGGTIEQIK